MVSLTNRRFLVDTADTRPPPSGPLVVVRDSLPSWVLILVSRFRLKYHLETFFFDDTFYAVCRRRLRVSWRGWPFPVELRNSG